MIIDSFGGIPIKSVITNIIDNKEDIFERHAEYYADLMFYGKIIFRKLLSLFFLCCRLLSILPLPPLFCNRRYYHSSIIIITIITL